MVEHCHSGDVCAVLEVMPTVLALTECLGALFFLIPISFVLIITNRIGKNMRTINAIYLWCIHVF